MEETKNTLALQTTDITNNLFGEYANKISLAKIKEIANELQIPYVLMRGGIEINNAPFQQEIRAQVEIAIEEADVIVYVADGKTGVSNDDLFACKMLYKSNKPIILAVNKIDDIYNELI